MNLRTVRAKSAEESNSNTSIYMDGRKCENSACVNRRHLVALSPEDHRAVHSTKYRTIKEQIYRGEWEKIQAAKAEERSRLERELLERDRQLRKQQLAEIERLRNLALAAEEERKKRLLREERWREFRARLKRFLYV